MSVRNDDNIIKSLVILAVCIVAMLMVCTECALLPQYGWNPDPVWAACHTMDMTLTGPRIPEDVVPSLPQAIWVEFMGIDEKPDSDDYEIAVDLVAGDFYYSPNLKDDGNRKGFALCVQHLTDYIASQMDEKKSHD